MNDFNNQGQGMPGNVPAGSARERLQGVASPAQPGNPSPAPAAAPAGDMPETAPTDVISAADENDLPSLTEGDVFGTVQVDDEAETMLALKSMEERRRKKRRSKIIRAVVIASIVALVIVAIVASRTQSSDTDVAHVPSMQAVEKRDFVNQTQGTGKLQPYNSVVVTPEVEGIIESVSVTEGQAVEKGQTLFTIKNDDLEKNVTSAQRDLDAAQRTVDSAQRALDDIYNQMEEARVAHNDAVAKAEAEQAQAVAGADTVASTTSIPEYSEASFQKQIDDANIAIANAEDGVAKAQDALDKARDAADKRTITAPMSGTVLSLAAKQGAGVGGGAAAAGATSKASTTSLAEIADLSQMKVTINVNEVDITNVTVGQEAEVTFSALPDVTLKGEVVSVASTTGDASADPAAAAAGAGASSGTVATYPVELVIKKPDSRLKPGMTASAVIKTQEVKDVVIAPTMGVYEQDGKHYVTVMTDNGDGTFASEQREVEVGEHNSTDTVIKSGLNEGEQVSLEVGSSAAGTAADGNAAASEAGRG